MVEVGDVWQLEPNRERVVVRLAAFQSDGTTCPKCGESHSFLPTWLNELRPQAPSAPFVLPCGVVVRATLSLAIHLVVLDIVAGGQHGSA